MPISNNYVFFDTRGTYVVQFIDEVVVEECKKIVSAAKQENPTEGELPVVVCQICVPTMKANIEIFGSKETVPSYLQHAQQLAQQGPKAFFDYIMPLYIPCVQSELKFAGLLFRLDGDSLSKYEGEPFVATDMEYIVSLFYNTKISK